MSTELPFTPDRYCVDCAFCLPSNSFSRGEARITYARCLTKQSFRSDAAFTAYLVSGKKLPNPEHLTYCSGMRELSGLCGRQGKLFQPKPAETLRLDVPGKSLPHSVLHSVLIKIRTLFTKPPYP